MAYCKHRLECKDFNPGGCGTLGVPEQCFNQKVVRTINREAFIDEYCGQIDPLFDKTDELMVALCRSQEALAEYILPDSTISDRDVINTLLEILDNGKLVVLMKELKLGEG